MKFTNIIDQRGSFYEVTDSQIEQAEKGLQIVFPKELIKFYKEIGYGFFESKKGNINRIMGPLSVRDFRLRQNDFEYYPDIDIYDIYEHNKLIFFEVNESVLFSIEINEEQKQKIYLYNTVISESLEEFIKLFLSDEDFFYNVNVTV